MANNVGGNYIICSSMCSMDVSCVSILINSSITLMPLLDAISATFLDGSIPMLRKFDPIKFCKKMSLRNLITRESLLIGLLIFHWPILKCLSYVLMYLKNAYSSWNTDLVLVDLR